MISIRPAIVAVLAGAAVFAVIEIGLLAIHARRDIDSLAGNVGSLLTSANQTAIQARDASEQAKLAAIEQRAYWSKTSLETYKTMASLRLTIVRTDRSLNETIAPRIAAALDGTTNLTAAAAGNLKTAIEELRPSMDNLSRASAAAADTLADPAIRETITHLDAMAAGAADTSTKAADAMAELDQSMAHVEKMTAATEARVEAAMRPASFTVRVIGVLFNVGAKAGAWAAGFIK